MSERPPSNDQTDTAAAGGLFGDRSALIDTTLALTDLVNDDPEAALRQVAGELRDLTGSRFCAIYALEVGGLRTLVINENGEFATEVEGRLFNVDEHPAAAAVLDSRRALALSSYGLPVCHSGDESIYAQSYEAGLLAPLLVRENEVGLIEICDATERDFAAEQETVEHLARIVARAVAVRRRLAARERMADELLELGELATEALSLVDLARSVAESLRVAIGAEDCDIWRIAGDQITCIASVDSKGWDPSVIGGVYNLSDYPWYSAAVAAGEVREIASRDDPRLSPSELAALDKWGYRCNLCLPLIAGDRRLGFIDIYDTRERDFAEHLDVIYTVGRMLAGAFEKVLLRDQLEQGNRDMEVLLEIGRTLASTLVIDDALAVIARKAGEALRAPRVIMYECLEDVEGIIARTTYERDPVEGWDETGVTRPLSKYAGDRAILESGTIVIERLGDPSLHAKTRRDMEAWGEQVCLNVPLVFKGTPLGIMMLIDTEPGREFDEHDLDFARAIGEQAVVAFQNARLNRLVKRQSDRDTLTGLYNARFFRQRLLAEVARSRRHGLPLSVLLLDVDEFRTFNDEFGRTRGNEVLRDVAAAIMEDRHAHIDVAARHGGSRFAVLMPCTPLRGNDDVADDATHTLGPHPGGAGAVAERIRAKIETLAEVAGSELERGITASIGVAELAESMLDGAALMDAAEEALAQGQAGRQEPRAGLVQFVEQLTQPAQAFSYVVVGQAKTDAQVAVEAEEFAGGDKGALLADEAHHELGRVDLLAVLHEADRGGVGREDLDVVARRRPPLHVLKATAHVLPGAGEDARAHVG
jgi:diguanylate cyclase (GGDEF)-like protein